MGAHVRAESPTQHVASITFEEETSANFLTPSRPLTEMSGISHSDVKLNATEKRPPPLPFLVYFMAGGIAGTIGAVTTCPLELVKTRFQSSHYRTNIGIPTIEIPFFKHPLRATWSHIHGTLDALKYSLNCRIPEYVFLNV